MGKGALLEKCTGGCNCGMDGRYLWTGGHIFLSGPQLLRCCEPRWVALGALGAKAAQHKVGGVQGEALGQLHVGHGQTVQAEGAAAAFAVKVCVVVVQALGFGFAAVAVGAAPSVFGHARTVADAVYEVVQQQEVQGAEDARLVHCAQPCFEVGERQGAFGRGQCLGHQQPYGGGTYAALCERSLGLCSQVVCFHFRKGGFYSFGSSDFRFVSARSEHSVVSQLLYAGA